MSQEKELIKRIELIEKVQWTDDDEQSELFESLGISQKQNSTTGYRRVWVRVEDITGVMELTKDETEVEFGSDSIIVKGGYEVIKKQVAAAS